MVFGRKRRKGVCRAAGLATPTRAQSARALPAAMASKAASSAAPISTGGGKKKQSSRGHGDGSDPGAYSPTHSLARRPSFGHYPDLQGISPMLGQSKPQVAAKMKQTGRAHKPGFHHTDQRRLVMDMGDAQSPGPGAYLPASTFGKHATYLKSSSSNPSRPSAVFRSGSPSRPRPINEHVPGPGAHTPNFGCQEKNVTNSAPHLKAKGIRPFSDWSADDAGKEVGPGAYESHVYRSLQKLCNEQVRMMAFACPYVALHPEWVLRACSLARIRAETLWTEFSHRGRVRDHTQKHLPCMKLHPRVARALVALKRSPAGVTLSIHLHTCG